MPADSGSLGALARLQHQMIRAVHGDAAAFAATVARIAPGDGPAEASAGKRLYLHLNTIDQALTGVLRQAYPATARLLGDPAFAGLARRFLRARPPSRPQLSGYGRGFDRFLADEGALSEPLAAVARLDWAAQEAYVAADSRVLDAAALAAVPAERQAGLRLALVPSARLLPLPAAPAWERWSALRDAASLSLVEPSGPRPAGPAGALVWRRPDLLVAARPLSGGELLCLAALAAGTPLLEAAEAAQGAAMAEASGHPDLDPGFDLGALFADALAGGIFQALAPGGP